MDFENNTNGLHTVDGSALLIDGMDGLAGDTATPPPIVADLDHQLDAIDEYNHNSHHNPFDLKAAAQANLGDNNFANSNGKYGAYNEQDEDDYSEPDDDDHDEDDDGPETDVDAHIDENNHNYQQQPQHVDNAVCLDDKVDHVINEVNQHHNPFDLVENLVKKTDHEELDQNPFEDNRYLENVSSGVAAELADAFARSKIDFSEKKEYSFEREDYEKDVTATLGDGQADGAFGVGAAQRNHPFGDEDDDDDGDDVHVPAHTNGNGFAADVVEQHDLVHTITTDVVTTQQHELPTTDNTVENVVVIESGDESEDEWNYVQVNKNGEEQTEKTKSTVNIRSPSPPTVSVDEPEQQQQPQEFGQQHLEELVDHQSVATPEESHAISQAFAVSEEICAELIHEKQELEEPELLALEQKEAEARQEELQHQLVAASDMEASHLNPDAMEFVPSSPTSPVRDSPFSNGSANNNQIQDLINEEKVLAQSPRKNGTPLMNEDDIELPTERDFGELIAKKPGDFESPTPDNGNGIASPNGGERRESIGSQDSDQQLNQKERMHGDEKQEMAEDIGININISDPLSGVIGENNVMNASFYDDQSGEVGNNPFSTAAEVDLNAVQVLPMDSAEDVNDENLPPQGNFINNFSEFKNGQQHGGALQNGQQYLIQDVEFGMSGDSQQDTPVDEPKHFAQHVAQLGNGINELHIDTHEVQQQANASNAPLSASISEVVHELANQVTSVLKDFPDEETALSPEPHVLETGSVASEQSIGAPSPLPSSQEHVIDEQINVSSLSTLSVEPQNSSTSQLITDVDEPLVPVVEPATTVTEPELQPEPAVEEAIAAGTVAAMTVVAAGAVAVAATAAKKPAVSKPGKPSDTKKPEVKARTTSTVGAAKKPTTAAAPLKTTARPASATATATKSTAKTLTASTRAAAPRPAPAKTLSTTARKPLANGTTGVKKTTTTTTTTTTTSSTLTKKPLSSTTTTVTKTAATRPASAATAKPATARTTTLTKPAPRPASATVPRATTTTKAPLKSTTATNSSTAAAGAAAKPLNSVAAARAAAAKRPITLSTRPAATKTTLQSPGKTATTTTTTTRKVESLKSPLGAKTGTLRTTSTTTRTSATTNGDVRKSLTASRATPAKTPTKKPATPASAAVGAKKSSANAVPKLPLTNGTGSHTTATVTTVTTEEIIVNQQSAIESNEINQNAVIDLSAD